MTDSDTFVEPPVFYCTDAIHRDIQDRARAEATAATEQRLRAGIETLPPAPCHRWHEHTDANGGIEHAARGSGAVDRTAVLALLDSDAPALRETTDSKEVADSSTSASPRQGEPVDGLDEAWKAAEAALPDGWDGPRMLPIGTRGSVSRWVASAIAHSAAARGNRAWIVDGSGPTPVEALRALVAALPPQASDSPEKP